MIAVILSIFWFFCLFQKYTILIFFKVSSKDSGESSSSSASTKDMPAAIKNVNVLLSLENCEKFIEIENHKARVASIRTEGLKYLQETAWMYQNNNNGTWRDLNKKVYYENLSLTYFYFLKRNNNKKKNI